MLRVFRLLRCITIKEWDKVNLWILLGAEKLAYYLRLHLNCVSCFGPTKMYNRQMFQSAAY